MKTKIRYFGRDGKFSSALFELSHDDWNRVNHFLNREPAAESFTGTVILSVEEIKIVSIMATYEWPIPKHLQSISDGVSPYLIPLLICPDEKTDVILKEFNE